MTGWDEFTDRLANQLAVLPAGAIVSIRERVPNPDRRRYAQFYQTDTKLYAELPGPGMLDPEVRADAAGLEYIADLGWQPPIGRDSYNWSFNVAWPAPRAEYHRLAAMITSGLRDAFGIAAPAQLTYTAWNENKGNADLALPLLGLEPTPNEAASATDPKLPARPKRRLLLTLSGDLDHDRLEQLRDTLGLSRRGRLDDPDAVQFGSRELGAGGDASVLAKLWRDGENRWSISVEVMPDALIDSTDVDQWQEMFETAARSVGFDVVEVREFP
ncbi:TY-Chap domain-containing protein [Nocardia sp. NPDC050412]|uniref:TY-Chap domain-containing protein n=1 Tax=Nocardia sp. NPDC050412 TaxID=3364320 RepID=UPI00379CC182